MMSNGGRGFHAAQEQHAAAGLGLGQPPGKAARADREVATVATVIAVPSPITKVEATPIQNRPCASANTSTMMAPEQGRRPTAMIADSPRRSQCGPFSSLRLRRVGVTPGMGFVAMVVT